MEDWFYEILYNPLSSLTEEQVKAIIILCFIFAIIELINKFGNMCLEKAFEIRDRRKHLKDY